MATSIEAAVMEAGLHLATLSRQERENAFKQIRQIVVTNLPDDEVGKPPVIELGPYLDKEIELPPSLVKPGIVYRGAITAMVSRGGKGKTTLSLNRLLRWSMGLPLFDELPDINAPEGPLRILIIENEGSPGHFQQVMRTILHNNNFSEEQIKLARTNVHIWGDGGWSGLKLDDPENTALVNRATAETKADIVFVEPFRGLWRGNENDSTEMANVLDALSALANDHNCGVILTHHENKNAEANDPMSAFRGSTAMEGAAAVMERWAPVRAGKQRELEWVKNRFDEPPPSQRMEFQRESWSYRFVPESEGKVQVKHYLASFPGTWFSIKDVQEELEESYSNVRRWGKELAEDKDESINTRGIDGKVHFRYAGGEDGADGLAVV